ncbi:hypothetical protein CLV73_3368 [Chryseobacterium geocarposphaerae]|uniref:Uncharacterized protein n=1 Tax=Chryseobacterium geocarposphaerae TaxID=1416776 RepID=A0A2M9BXQ4_9FLAO|nr:hypothetical protein CLV73_3368 [Chryseobacterium geocarposphaerae]
MSQPFLYNYIILMSVIRSHSKDFSKPSLFLDIPFSSLVPCGVLLKISEIIL